MDSQRQRALMKAHSHFDEHVMFRQHSPGLAEDVFRKMDQEYDHLTPDGFRRQYEEFAQEIGRTLPELAKALVLQHLAFFQLLDDGSPNESQRTADIRDSHGLLFGNVTQADVDQIMRYSAGFER